MERGEPETVAGGFRHSRLSLIGAGPTHPWMLAMLRNDAQQLATVNSGSIVIMLETTIRVARAGEERTADGRGPASYLPMRARGADRNAIRRELTRRTASTDTLHDENYGERQR